MMAAMEMAPTTRAANRNALERQMVSKREKEELLKKEGMGRRQVSTLNVSSITGCGTQTAVGRLPRKSGLASRP